MSTTWFTSDLHFGHTNIIKLGNGRPFDTIEEHDEYFLQHWADTVSKRDTIWVLGDLCLKKGDALQELNDQLSKLPGAKKLILGNHDAGSPAYGKSGHHNQLSRYTAFDSVQLNGITTIARTKVLLSHYPYSWDHDEKQRFMQWRLPDLGKFLIHGHTHQTERAITSRQVHVGVDAWDYKFVPADTIASIIEEAS